MTLATGGFGTETRGGTGGRVLRVTSLADDGPGTLRWACRQRFPRIVVFEVGGLITLRKFVGITSPFMTIAGETAPPPGVTIRGAQIAPKTHDIRIRHLRLRVGDLPGGTRPQNRDALEITSDRSGRRPVFNIDIDHCSLSWAVDEIASLFFGPGVHDVTIRRSILSEALSNSTHPKGEHSKGLLIGNNIRNVSVRGNLFAHNKDRNPVVGADTSTVIANNLLYNYGTAVSFSPGKSKLPMSSSVVCNVAIAGPNTRFPHAVFVKRSVAEGSVIYTRDNLAVGSDRPDSIVYQSAKDTSRRSPGRDFDVEGRAPPIWDGVGKATPADQVAGCVLAEAGARPQDRDAADVRVIASVRDRTGRWIDSQAEVGGWSEQAFTQHRLNVPSEPDRVENWLRDWGNRAERHGYT